MQTKTSLAKIQRAMYQRLQGYARNHRPNIRSQLGKYLREYQFEMGTFQKLSNKRELVRAVIRSPIVIVGDYHTLPQAQRTLVRVLRASIGKLEGKPIVIALEWLAPEDNLNVTRYLKGQIGEEKFLSEVQFFQRWGFPWENYRSLFEFARENKIMMIGLSKKRETNLRSRDRFAAKRIASLFELYPNVQCFALIGDLHLAKGHLPRAIRTELRKSRRILTIHQNIERFYWNLMERGLQDKVDVVQVNTDSFCVLATPPWLKLQSHLQWLELTDHPGTLADAFNEIDFSDEIATVIQQIQSFLKIKRPVERIDFKMRGPSDFSFLSSLDLSSATVSTLKVFLKNFESFFIPMENILFLSNLSPNQLASQSAILLHSSLSGFCKIFTSPARDFYDFVWVEALGYFGSKILNPKRKCNGLTDLIRITSEKSVKISHREFKVTPDTAAWCAHHLRNEPRLRNLLPQRTTPSGLIFYYKNAKTLGHLLGEGLYRAAISGRIDKATLQSLFTNHPANSRSSYRSWSTLLSRWKLRHLSKHDTF